MGGDAEAAGVRDALPVHHQQVGFVLQLFERLLNEGSFAVREEAGHVRKGDRAMHHHFLDNLIRGGPPNDGCGAAGFAIATESEVYTGNEFHVLGHAFHPYIIGEAGLEGEGFTGGEVPLRLALESHGVLALSLYEQFFTSLPR